MFRKFAQLEAGTGDQEFFPAAEAVAAIWPESQRSKTRDGIGSYIDY
jgi:hypothetical protein